LKSYIHGYYCPSDIELNILEKESNRKILEALRDAYPSARNAHELAEITGLPIKTIYAQLNELSRGGFITELPKISNIRRGRPQTHYSSPAIVEDNIDNLQQRQRSRFVIEDTKGIYSIYNEDEAQKTNQKKRSIPLPPGNVVYSNEFIEVWHKIVGKEEEDELCTALLNFLDKTLRRINELSKDDDKIRRIVPSAPPSPSLSSAGLKQIDKNYCCCSLCGLNHEARDFMRAMLLYLLDQLEENSRFIKLLKNNRFLTQEAYQRLAEKIEARNQVLKEQEEVKKGCNHIIDVTDNNDRHISPRTAGCEECEIEKTQWVGLRLCLTCGHVGCCDSSIGLHATKHFVNTGHPVMVALPNKPWKWCYIHKVYG
jgi:Zn-finger in ubiquitin-hydrolases and other protein